MEALIRKHWWAVDLGMVGVCAVFLARASSSAVELELVVPSKRSVTPPASSKTSGSYPKQGEQIVRRNLFCSTCPPIVPLPGEPVPTMAKPMAPQKSSLPLVLVAVMRSPPVGSRWSVAVIRDAEDRSIGAFAKGTKLHDATISEIEETRVYLDNAGRKEYLDLLDESLSTVKTKSAAVAAAVSSGDYLSQEMDRGVRKTGEYSYDIQRATLEAVLGNTNLLARSARIVPESKEGRAAGFRLYSVRPDGPFAKIGLQNGDVISSINGLELTSIEKSFEVYGKLRSASHLALGVERNGQKVTMDYGIR
jgi:general secretion pathway protein C